MRCCTPDSNGNARRCCDRGVDDEKARPPPRFVHRDVAPANVLLSFRTGVARLGDFGMCRTIGHALDRTLSPTTSSMYITACNVPLITHECQ